jgi:hypothetical protein
MTATVGMLLDDVHSRTWDLCSRVGELRDEAALERLGGELLAAWPRLAAAVLEVLDAVPVKPAWLDDAVSVREVLRAVAERQASASHTSAANAPEPRLPCQAVEDISTRLAAVGDLLVGQPAARTAVDRDAWAGLQANVVTVAHAVASATLAVMGDRRDLPTETSLMRGVVVRSERFAAVPAEGRTGRYEDLAAVSSDDGSLDTAIERWLPPTLDVLASRHRVSQVSLQSTAGDALIVIATAGAVIRAAVQTGHLAPDVAGPALSSLGEAHHAWRPCVAWPATVRLGGVRDLD